MFKKSLMGPYCNKLQDLGERHDPFFMLWQRAQEKILMSQILMQKRAHQIVS